jgi:TetR/AcrR family transcriptional regulator
VKLGLASTSRLPITLNLPTSAEEESTVRPKSARVPSRKATKKKKMRHSTSKITANTANNATTATTATTTTTTTTTPAAAAIDPPARKKKERNAVETKRRILEAAAVEFAKKGFDGARLGTIARAADVQQALIHHYFVDKEGLHSAVVQGGLTAMTEGAWGLLSQMDAPVADRKGKKRRGPEELRALAEAFVDLLLGFFATNGSFLSILRHEASAGTGTKIVAENVAPVFEAIVARLDEMRARGEVRRDVDARHLVLSCVAMIAFPFQEQPFVEAIWPVEWHRPEHLAARKKHVVEMILARVLP